MRVDETPVGAGPILRFCGCAAGLETVSCQSSHGVVAAHDPRELPLEAGGIEFAQQAEYTAAVGQLGQIGIVHEDSGCRRPLGKGGLGRGGCNHGGEIYERKIGALEQGAGHRERDGAADVGEGVGIGRADVEDKWLGGQREECGEVLGCDRRVARHVRGLG